MKSVFTSRLRRLLWVAALTLFVAVAVFPISNWFTRVGGSGLLCIVWFGLIAHLWHRSLIRFALLGLTIACSSFLIWPVERPADPAALRRDYVAGLRRYESAQYFWGGESFKGIDCSGLIRRGLIDALFCRGIQSFNPSLVRQAIRLWWHDCSAQALSEEYEGFTVHLLDTPSVNALEHSRLLPGDLAATKSGIHIMAYLGDHLWIEADPGEGRVITVSAPSEKNFWFHEPMKIVRWSSLRELNEGR